MNLGVSRQTSPLVWWVGILLGTWLTQWLGGIPWLWLAPVMVIFLMDGSLVYLSGLIVIGELMTSMLPGIIMVMVLVPWLIWRVGKPQIDLSVVFWLWMAGLISGQAVIYFLPEIISAVRLLPEYQQAANNLAVGIPWSKTAVPLLLAIIISYVVVVVIYFNRRSTNIIT